MRTVTRLLHILVYNRSRQRAAQQFAGGTQEAHIDQHKPAIKQKITSQGSLVLGNGFVINESRCFFAMIIGLSRQ